MELRNVRCHLRNVSCRAAKLVGVRGPFRISRQFAYTVCSIFHWQGSPSPRACSDRSEFQSCPAAWERGARPEPLRSLSSSDLHWPRSKTPCQAKGNDRETVQLQQLRNNTNIHPYNDSYTGIHPQHPKVHAGPSCSAA